MFGPLYDLYFKMNGEVSIWYDCSMLRYCRAHFLNCIQ